MAKPTTTYHPPVDPRPPEPTPFRAINIVNGHSLPNTYDNDHPGIQEWFFTHNCMVQYLRALKLKASENSNGSIRDQNDHVVGVWYFITLTTRPADLVH